MRFLAAALLVVAATATAQPSTSIDVDIARRVRADVEFLSSDALEGRDTGSRGYAIAADYVASQFRAIGLQPAGDKGGWFQQVPFRRATHAKPPVMAMTIGGKEVPLKDGIDASIRQVDSAQYAVRQNEFDFDMTSLALSLTATPTYDTLENVFHSRAASVSGSRNLPGTASPAVDRLIEVAGNAKSRDELTVALRALDRVLRARMDWIPNWYSANHRVAFWDMFGFVEPKPDYGFPVETMWWFDKDKAAAIGKA